MFRTLVHSLDDSEASSHSPIARISLSFFSAGSAEFIVLFARVCPSDEYFYSEVGDDPQVYDYDIGLLPHARDWDYAAFQQAVAVQNLGHRDRPLEGREAGTIS